MQWDGGACGGFTDGTPWILPPENYRTINVQAELRDPDSILHYYRRLIRLRKEEPAISEGQIEFLLQDVPEVFAYRRFLGEEALLVVCNLTGHSVPLDGGAWEGCEKVLGNYADSSAVLRPYEAVVRKTHPRAETLP